MNDESYTLLARADQALQSAERLAEAGDLFGATNRVYFGCYYAVHAMLTAQEIHLNSHRATRQHLRIDLVGRGVIPSAYERFFLEAWEFRKRADYWPEPGIEAGDVSRLLRTARALLARARRTLIA